MARFVRAEGRWMPRDEWEAMQARQSHGLTVIKDFSESVVNPVDGRAYSTRREYEAATRRAGAVELGHAEHRKMRATPRRMDLGDPTPAIMRAIERHG